MCLCSKVRTLERQLEAERQGMANQQQYAETLEDSLNQVADDAKKQVRGCNAGIIS